MKRRDFLKRTTPAITIPVLLGGLNITAIGKSNLLQMLNASEENDKVLVLVQLNGGNDGLNTVIPVDQYSKLFDARSNIIIPESKIISLNGISGTGLHPAMAPLRNLWEDEKLGIVQSVGYPNPNFSHFRSTDIITSASDSNELINSGWLGRYLAEDHSMYPEGYPNEEYPDPLAITVGSYVSTTCQGPITNMGIAINDVDRFYNPVGGGSGEPPESPYGYELEFVRETQIQTQLYLESVSTAASKAENLSPLYAEGNNLGDQFKVVARLIAGGLKTKIFVVSIGGFDTHADQVDQTLGNEYGTHAQLLTRLSDAIEAFQDDIFRLGIEDRVVGMTFSEFGRRVKSNNSFGSDHGTSWPLMVFGSNVSPVIHGSNPFIPTNASQSSNLSMQYDFRSIYGSILKDWLNVPEEIINSVMMGEFDYVPVIKSNVVTGIGEPGADLAELINYPNPSNEYTEISFNSQGGHVDLSVYSINGKRINTLIDKSLTKGKHSINYETSALKAGIYVINMRNNKHQASRKMIVAH